MLKMFSFLPPLLWAALIWRLTTVPNLVVAPETWLNTLIMSGSHFFFFGVLAVLFGSAITTNHHKSTMYYSVLMTSLYGLLIELVQRGIPGRSMDPVDWLLDTLGALVFLGIFHKFSNPKYANSQM